MTWDIDADSAFNWYNQTTADNLIAAQSWTRYDPLIAIRASSSSSHTAICT